LLEHFSLKWPMSENFKKLICLSEMANIFVLSASNIK